MPVLNRPNPPLLRVFARAKAVDGEAVLWVEPLTDALDDRLLVMSEVYDLDVATPPPPSISYRKSAFLPRFSGMAMVEVVGSIDDRLPGSCDVWRYRAAGDLFLQVESRPGVTTILFVEAIHKGMVDVLPGP